jgi:hypothetical protein
VAGQARTVVYMDPLAKVVIEIRLHLNNNFNLNFVSAGTQLLAVFIEALGSIEGKS